MTDQRDLERLLGGRLRALPEVDRLFPRPGAVPLPLRAVADLLDRGDEEVAVSAGRVDASVGLGAAVSAVDAGTACARAVRAALPPDRAGSVIRIRIAAVE